LIKKVITDSPYDLIFETIKRITQQETYRFDNSVKIPHEAGVYLIYKKPYKNKEFSYVGQSQQLYARLDSIRKASLRNHILVRKIAKEYHETDRNKLKEIIHNNYEFSFIATKSTELALVIESIIIRIFKKQLSYNKAKIYQYEEEFEELANLLPV